MTAARLDCRRSFSRHASPLGVLSLGTAADLEQGSRTGSKPEEQSAQHHHHCASQHSCWKATASLRGCPGTAMEMACARDQVARIRLCQAWFPAQHQGHAPAVIPQNHHHSAGWSKKRWKSCLALALPSPYPCGGWRLPGVTAQGEPNLSRRRDDAGATTCPCRPSQRLGTPLCSPRLPPPCHHLSRPAALTQRWGWVTGHSPTAVAAAGTTRAGGLLFCPRGTQGLLCHCKVFPSWCAWVWFSVLSSGCENVVKHLPTFS